MAVTWQLHGSYMAEARASDARLLSIELPLGVPTGRCGKEFESMHRHVLHEHVCAARWLQEKTAVDGGCLESSRRRHERGHVRHVQGALWEATPVSRSDDSVLDRHGTRPGPGPARIGTPETGRRSGGPMCLRWGIRWGMCAAVAGADTWADAAADAGSCYERCEYLTGSIKRYRVKGRRGLRCLEVSYHSRLDIVAVL